MNDQLENINKLIKVTWNKFFRVIILLLIVLALVFYILNLKVQKYNKEFESTTWYEAVAQYTHSFYHRDRKNHGDDYEYKNYYDWHFTYVGRDGNTYNYVEKNHGFEADDGYTTTIYVDENDNSHSLKIENFKSQNNTIKKVVFIILAPYSFIYLIRFLILYKKKSNAKNFIST